MLAPLLEQTDDELSRWLGERKEPAFRLRQIRRSLFVGRRHTFDAMTDLPALLRVQLAESFRPLSSAIELTRATSDDTRKLLIRLSDGEAVECVVLAEESRRTVCVSTQVGCGMACAFCASGLAGLRRNLASHEIIEQFLHATQQLAPDERLSHAVIMGMGEPLANLDHLLAALDTICARDGLGISQRHITISTVGLPQQMRRLANHGRGYHLAVSLHAPDDSIRNELVPPNARIGIRRVVQAADAFFERTGRQVTYEYVLLRDVNDRSEHAHQLARLLSPRSVHINLIPFNPVTGLGFATPRSEQIEQFATILRRAGLIVHVRKTKGRRIEAACGQLRLQASAAAVAGLSPRAIETAQRP